MDDFNLASLRESRNEYTSLFINKLTPLIMQGIYSIFKEARDLCIENDEEEKYLMTFQNFLGRTPKWNNEIIENETNRIIQESGCNYLEDLLTCVHINELKILTCIRVGTKQKKINLNIPRLGEFIHKIYVNLARNLYKNVFLFQLHIQPLERQKNLREFENIVKEIIIETIRENMPVEAILKAYLDETIEEYADETKEEVKEIQEEVDEEVDEEDDTQENNNTMDNNTTNVDNSNNINTYQNNNEEIHNNSEKSVDIKQNGGEIEERNNNEERNNVLDNNDKEQTLSFNDIDNIKSYETNETPENISNKNEETQTVIKTKENLEKISNERYEQRKLEEMQEESDEENDKLVIQDKNIVLDTLDVQDLNSTPEIDINLDIEEL